MAVAVVIGLRDVTVRADALTELVLPDGSEVTLAPGAEIEYRRGLWGDVRAVRLDGQAAFHVRADGRPFRVETFNATVEVLGTTFDVRAWGHAAAPETAVALVEGSVRLADAQGRAVVLAPGQSSRVGRGAPTMRPRPPTPTPSPPGATAGSPSWTPRWAPSSKRSKPSSA